jgi:hypothetical protein
MSAAAFDGQSSVANACAHAARPRHHGGHTAAPECLIDRPDLIVVV